MPVDAPDGTAALADTRRAEAIASTVGVPRESRISLPITFVIVVVRGICLAREVKIESHLSIIVRRATQLFGNVFKSTGTWNFISSVSRSSRLPYLEIHETMSVRDHCVRNAAC